MVRLNILDSTHRNKLTILCSRYELASLSSHKVYKIVVDTNTLFQFLMARYSESETRFNSRLACKVLSVPRDYINETIKRVPT